MSGITVHGTDLPPGVYDAEEDEVWVHTPNIRYQLRTTTPHPSYDPNRPMCPRVPCLGEEDDCENVKSEPAWRLTRREAAGDVTAGAAWMEAKISYLSPTDIARGAMAAVSWENAAIRGWSALTELERDEARALVNAALIRLLTDQGWMRGAVEVKPGRLTVRIAIETGDSGPERIRARATVELAEESIRAGKGLRRVAADMKEGDEGAPST